MYPPDIDETSGCRLPLVARADLDAEAQAIFDRHVVPGTHTIRGLRGPGGLLLHSPELAKRSGPVGQYLRTQAGFTPRVREVAILITARCCDSAFEWAAHEDEALKASVPRATIEAIRGGTALDGLDPTDAAIITLGRAIFLDRQVPADLYARALQTFGVRPLLDLVALMGSYASTAAMLCAFAMQLDPGVADPFAATPGG